MQVTKKKKKSVLKSAPRALFQCLLSFHFAASRQIEEAFFSLQRHAKRGPLRSIRLFVFWGHAVAFETSVGRAGKAAPPMPRGALTT